MKLITVAIATIALAAAPASALAAPAVHQFYQADGIGATAVYKGQYCNEALTYLMPEDMRGPKSFQMLFVDTSTSTVTAACMAPVKDSKSLDFYGVYLQDAIGPRVGDACNGRVGGKLTADGKVAFVFLRDSDKSTGKCHRQGEADALLLAPLGKRV